MKRLTATLSERLWGKVNKTETCWLWTGGESSGYGTIRAGKPERKQLYAHRVTYEMEYGPIAKGMAIDHACHNKLCVNPAHLRAVTYKQNGEHRKGAPRNSSTGFLGVTQRGASRWQGQLSHNGKGYSAGYHDTPEGAAEAVRQLRLSLFTHNDQDRRTA